MVSIVKHTFRNYGVMMVPGSIVEPATIKRYKSRVGTGHIIQVHEQDLDKYKVYFKERHGVDLKLPEAPKEPVPPVKPTAVAKAAVVVKPH